jgi:hypothetical protein
MTSEITITKTEYRRLLKRDLVLERLEIGGVDNWEWYGASLNPDEKKSLDECETEIDEKYKD